MDTPMVRVAGFEPTASWTRTKRDTKLRHTRIECLFIIMIFAGIVKRFLPAFPGTCIVYPRRGKQRNIAVSIVIKRGV